MKYFIDGEIVERQRWEVVVEADTEDDARRIASEAAKSHLDCVEWTWLDYNDTPAPSYADVGSRPIGEDEEDLPFIAMDSPMWREMAQQAQLACGEGI